MKGEVEECAENQLMINRGLSAALDRLFYSAVRCQKYKNRMNVMKGAREVVLEEKDSLLCGAFASACSRQRGVHRSRRKTFARTTSPGPVFLLPRIYARCAALSHTHSPNGCRGLD